MNCFRLSPVIRIDQNVFPDFQVHFAPYVFVASTNVAFVAEFITQTFRLSFFVDAKFETALRKFDSSV